MPRKKRDAASGGELGEKTQGQQDAVAESTPVMDNAKEESASGGASYSAPGADESPKPKLVIPLNERGGADRESMRAGTQAKLDRLILLEPRSMPKSEVKPSDIEYLFNLLGQAEAFVWTRVYKIPRDLQDAIARLCLYSTEDIEYLNPIIQELLAKYHVDMQFLPEIKFVVAMCVIQSRKTMAIRMELALYQARAAEAERLRRSSAPSESGAVGQVA